MPRRLPPIVVRLVERRLPPRLAHDVTGELEERWHAARASRLRACLAVARLTASVLWHAARDARRHPAHPPATGGDAMLTGLLQDLTFTWRTGVRQPWLSAAAVATLALGIGATTALFSVMHAWLLTPLPYRDPARLVAAWETIPSASVFENTPAPATLTQWKARARSFEGLAAFTAAVENLTGAGDPVQLTTARVSRDLLPLLGVSPALGRNFTAEENQPNGPAVTILTHETWTTRYGARPDILGHPITLSGVPTTIVGVLPREMAIVPFRPDLWQPLALSAEEAASENRFLWVIGRLAPGATVEGATAELDAIMRDGSKAALGARVVPLHDQMIGTLNRDILTLFAATGLVLLIACANVASLTLVRMTGRRQELIVRTALGATRRRVIRQILTESLALGVAGGIAGLLLAAWAIRAVVTLAPDAQRLPDVSLGVPAVWAFAMGAAALTSLLFGLVPAWRSAGLPIASAMREGAPSVAGGRQWLLRGVVAAEVALALALLAGTGLIVRSHRNLSAVDLGFDPRDVVAFELSRPSTESRDGSVAFYRELLRRLPESPAVQSAALTQALPLRSMAMGAGFRIEGGSGNRASVLSYWRTVSNDYFTTLTIPVIAGRPFDARDGAGGEKVAIVTASFARHAWSDGEAVGRRIGWGTLEVPLTVVGVVGDVRLSPAVAPGPHVYMPFEQVPYRLPHELVVRADAGAAATIDLVRRTVWAIDPSQPVSGITTMAALQDRTMNRRRFRLTIFSIAAGLAVALALVGIYGVLSYAAGQMSAELGLRAALGASRGGLVWQVMRMGLAPTLLGIAAGGLAAWWSAGVLRGFLYGVEPRDPMTFAAVAGLLTLSAAAACLVPAWRAALTDPLITMRSR